MVACARLRRMEGAGKSEFFEVEHLPPHSGNADFCVPRASVWAQLPREQTIFRADQGTLFQEKWLARVDPRGSGSRLLGGRHLITLAM